VCGIRKEHHEISPTIALRSADAGAVRRKYAGSDGGKCRDTGGRLRRAYNFSQRSDASRSWPEDSVYQLDLTLQIQTGQQVPLSVDAGSPVLVSMFYNSCEYVCPMLIETLQMTETALTKRERAKLNDAGQF
jgi:hypothetical protein